MYVYVVMHDLNVDSLDPYEIINGIYSTLEEAMAKANEIGSTCWVEKHKLNVCSM